MKVEVDFNKLNHKFMFINDKVTIANFLGILKENDMIDKKTFDELIPKFSIWRE